MVMREQDAFDFVDAFGLQSLGAVGGVDEQGAGAVDQGVTGGQRRACAGCREPLRSSRQRCFCRRGLVGPARLHR